MEFAGVGGDEGWLRAGRLVEVLADWSEILLAGFGKERIAAQGIKAGEPGFCALFGPGFNLLDLLDWLDKQAFADAGDSHAVAFQTKFLRQAHGLAAAFLEEFGIGVLWIG
jgi:hypothetical protein